MESHGARRHHQAEELERDVPNNVRNQACTADGMQAEGYRRPDIEGQDSGTEERSEPKGRDPGIEHQGCTDVPPKDLEEVLAVEGTSTHSP
ncbi:hypothetical protein GCM10023063_32990 [Arthrobacter methylotrophus]|uniref:Uncharacterized protein n=1 Tax=Arthrobacter methylotrophus TaxID=121291 RepID=A0ABV5UJI1_9MICC